MTERIFAKDPDAKNRMARRIEDMQGQRSTMKLANKMVSAGNRDGLARLGFRPEQVEELVRDGGFPMRTIRNLTSNIDNMKRRLREVS
jgi:hypothetical protein